MGVFVIGLKGLFVLSYYGTGLLDDWDARSNFGYPNLAIRMPDPVLAIQILQLMFIGQRDRGYV